MKTRSAPPQKVRARNAAKRSGRARQRGVACGAGAAFSGQVFVLPRHRGVAKSIQYLSRHWHRPIGVEDLVRASSMSRRGFVKAFRRHFRHGPGAELRRVRLDAAKDLLVRSDITLAAIGEMCGYPLLNSFLVAFKFFTGLTPGEYREVHKTAGTNPGELREPRRLRTA